jgi:GNAT superfamily N-acetyltransferase
MLVAIQNEATFDDKRQDELAIMAMFVEEQSMAMTVLTQAGDASIASLSASKSPRMEVVDPSLESQKRESSSGQALYFEWCLRCSGYRCRGIGKAVLQEVIRVGEANAKTRQVNEVHFQVRVAEDNIAAVRMYESVGFRALLQEFVVMGAEIKTVPCLS